MPQWPGISVISSIGWRASSSGQFRWCPWYTCRLPHHCRATPPCCLCLRLMGKFSRDIQYISEQPFPPGVLLLCAWYASLRNKMSGKVNLSGICLLCNISFKVVVEQKYYDSNRKGNSLNRILIIHSRKPRRDRNARKKTSFELSSTYSNTGVDQKQ